MDDDLIIEVINESVLHYLHVMEQLIIKSIQDVNLIDQCTNTKTSL